MARKKSASGRSRGVSAVQRIMIQTERINKRLRALEKAGLYGTYKSRELQEFISRTAGVAIKKSKKGTHTVTITAPRMTTQQERLISKKFNEFLGSSLSTPIGIKKARANMRKKIGETLSDQLGRTMSESDVDKFLDIAKYAERVRQASILEYIDPSQFMVLVEQAKSANLSEEGWFSLLNKYVKINNETMREEAKDLYNRYVA